MDNVFAAVFQVGVGSYHIAIGAYMPCIWLAEHNFNVKQSVATKVIQREVAFMPKDWQSNEGSLPRDGIYTELESIDQ